MYYLRYKCVLDVGISTKVVTNKYHRGYSCTSTGKATLISHQCLRVLFSPEVKETFESTAILQHNLRRNTERSYRAEILSLK